LEYGLTKFRFVTVLLSSKDPALAGPLGGILGLGYEVPDWLGLGHGGLGGQKQLSARIFGISRSRSRTVAVMRARVRARAFSKPWPMRQPYGISALSIGGAITLAQFSQKLIA